MNMYATLIPQIKATLEGCSAVKAIYAHPKTKLDAFPAVVFFPDGMDNAYETTVDNAKEYSFSLIVVCGANHKTGGEVPNLFTSVLPKVVDQIVASFDTGWDRGTIAGHRVWATLASADRWGIEESQDGITAYAPMRLKVRLLTSN